MKSTSKPNNLREVATALVAASILGATGSAASANVAAAISTRDGTIDPLPAVSVIGAAPIPASMQKSHIECTEGTQSFAMMQGTETILWCARPGKNGKHVRQGQWAVYQAGKKAVSGSFLAGQRHGTWTFFAHRDGEKSSEGNYKAGQLDGTWTSWDVTGEIESVDEYSAGRLLGHTAFVALDAVPSVVAETSLQMQKVDWAPPSASDKEEVVTELNKNDIVIESIQTIEPLKTSGSKKVTTGG